MRAMLSNADFLLQMAGVRCKGSELDSISAAQQFLLQHCKVCISPPASAALSQLTMLSSVAHGLFFCS